MLNYLTIFCSFGKSELAFCKGVASISGDILPFMFLKSGGTLIFFSEIFTAVPMMLRIMTSSYMLTNSLYPRICVQLSCMAFFVISCLSSPHQLSLSVVFYDISLTERADTVEPNHIFTSRGNVFEVMK